MAHLSDCTDEELMERVAHDEQPAFTELFQRHHDRATGFVKKVVWRSRAASLLDDIVQECFFAVYAHRASYRIGAPFLPWFNQILFHHCMKCMKREGSRGGVSLEAIEEPTVEYVQPDLDDAPSLDVLRQVKKLPSLQRELIEAVYLRDMTVTQAAADCGVSRAAARWHLGAGLERLRQTTNLWPAAMHLECDQSAA